MVYAGFLEGGGAARPGLEVWGYQGLFGFRV